MIRALAVACLLALLSGGCATATPSPDARDGYLAKSLRGVLLYETRAQRDEGGHEGCIQIVRRETIQNRPLSNGRVRVTGLYGVFNGDDVVFLRTGGDAAHYEVCDSRYIIGAEITPLSEN